MLGVIRITIDQHYGVGADVPAAMVACVLDIMQGEPSSAKREALISKLLDDLTPGARCRVLLDVANALGTFGEAVDG